MKKAISILLVLCFIFIFLPCGSADQIEEIMTDPAVEEPAQAAEGAPKYVAASTALGCSETYALQSYYGAPPIGHLYLEKPGPYHPVTQYTSYYNIYYREKDKGDGIPEPQSLEVVHNVPGLQTEVSTYDGRVGFILSFGRKTAVGDYDVRIKFNGEEIPFKLTVCEAGQIPIVTTKSYCQLPSNDVPLVIPATAWFDIFADDAGVGSCSFGANWQIAYDFSAKLSEGTFTIAKIGGDMVLATFELITRHYEADGSMNHYVVHVPIFKAGVTPTIYEDAPDEEEPPAPPEPLQPTQATYDFVRRLYEKVLNRAPEEKGLEDWAYALADGTFTGATAAENFVFGKEFAGRNVSDEQFVNIMYETFMNRSADASGKKMWMNYLASGVSRKHVCKGFIDSGEFGKICGQYGIQRGNMVLTDYADQNYGLTMFINRLYTKALARTADRAGVETWCKYVLTGQGKPVDAAHQIVFSAEFTNKKLSDTEYIKTMYRTFMDREADAGGLKSWQDYLKAGHTREDVFNGFAYSPEFTKLMASYGLSDGV